MSDSLKKRWIDPLIIPLVIVAVALGIIALMGESLLALVRPGETKDRLDRPELWWALLLGLGIIGVCAFIASRPRGTTGRLEANVVIGTRPFFQEALAPVSDRARSGALGAVSDIGPGYTLYAQSGALAEVIGTLPGGQDVGKYFSGYLYSKGLFGASPELWIPFEAVMSVYPETKSAFLAIKGDETEHFGWTVPPENVRRGAARGTRELS